MILPIYTYGQPVLREVAQDILPDYPNIQELIENMYETMENIDGVGLAAPQIGLSIRVLVVAADAFSDVSEEEAHNEVFINAHVVEKDETVIEPFEEGCLSIPGISESVRRPKRVKVKWLDKDFQPHEAWFDGFLARVLQHEIDHLDGKLFIDHISPLRKQLIKKKLNNLLNGRFTCRYKVKTKS